MRSISPMEMKNTIAILTVRSANKTFDHRVSDPVVMVYTELFGGIRFIHITHGIVNAKVGQSKSDSFNVSAADIQR